MVNCQVMEEEYIKEVLEENYLGLVGLERFAILLPLPCKIGFLVSGTLSGPSLLKGYLSSEVFFSS